MVAALKQKEKNMSQNKGRKPTHVAFKVQEGANDKSFWNRIGVAWQHEDGKGFNIQLDVVPLDGAVTLRSFDDKRD